MNKEEIKRVLRTLNQDKDQTPEILYWLCEGLKNDEVGAKIRTGETNVHNKKRMIEAALATIGIHNVLSTEVCEALHELVDDPPQFYPWPPEGYREGDAGRVREESQQEKDVEQTEEEVVEDEQTEEEETKSEYHLPPVTAPPPRRRVTRPSWLTQQNIITALLALIFVLGFILVINWQGVFAPEPGPTIVAVVETEVIENTPDSTNPTRTPNPTQTQEMAGTLTAVYAAITATAFKTPIPTSIPTRTPAPTNTPTVTITPTATIEPTATITPTETPSPTPSIILPWEDDFNNGINPEWKKLGGEYSIDFRNGSGWLTPLDPSECLSLQVGDELPKNFAVEMNNLPRSSLGGWAVRNRLSITIGGKITIFPATIRLYWSSFDSPEIKSFDRGPELDAATHLRVEALGTHYVFWMNGVVQGEFIHPTAEATGPITIELCGFVHIDNFRIESLP